MEQELLTLPEYLSSPPIFIGVRVTRSLVLYVCFVDRCLFYTLHGYTQSQTEVARQFNVHQSTRAQFHGRDNQTGSAHNRPKSGRPRITTPSQVRYIRVTHLRNRTITTATTVSTSDLRRISTETVRNRLRQRGIRPACGQQYPTTRKKPSVCPGKFNGSTL